jgi:hypothetical protein
MLWDSVIHTTPTQFILNGSLFISAGNRIHDCFALHKLQYFINLLVYNQTNLALVEWLPRFTST